MAAAIVGLAPVRYAEARARALNLQVADCALRVDGRETVLFEESRSVMRSGERVACNVGAEFVVAIGGLRSSGWWGGVVG